MKKYAVMKKKFLLILLLRQFINNRKKPRKNSIRKFILLKKSFFCSQSLNVALSLIDLKAKRRVWSFYREELWFQHMWNNRNDLAIWQQLRTDFCMTPDTLLDIVILVRNRIEKQVAQFRETVPVEKRVAISLWCLATENFYRSISKTFSAGKSTAVSIRKSFCAEISPLSKYCIKFFEKPKWNSHNNCYI